MKRFLILLCVVTNLYASPEGMVKKRNIMRGPSTTDVKQSIATSFEKMLTSTSRLIASLSRKIDVVLKKGRQLIAQEETFFSRAKPSKLEQYKERLSGICQKFEKQVREIEKDIELLEKDFELS